jgi:Ca2+-dependent lipid-binding protein
MEEDSTGKRRNILSKIPTVGGTRASRAQEAAEQDEDVKKTQMKIAKDLTRLEFEKAFPHLRRVDYVDTEERTAAELAEAEALRMKELLEERMRRTLSMIGSPDNDKLYSTYDERAFYTDAMTLEIMKDMKIKLKVDSSTVASVSKSLRVNLKAALFGCDVHVGVCADANASELVFVGENDYSRRELRGQSTVFECLDKRDIVVQALQRPRTADSKRNAFSRGSLELGANDRPANEEVAQITSGEAVVYVPLLGKRGGVGCVEIHGLFSDELTDPARYERRTAALHSMILKQDFRFIHSLRLWRLPSQRLEYASDEQRTRFSRNDYHLVCGRITEVVHTRNGVPFVGGAHYAINWEDGWFEEAVSAQELLKTYANTPASLGTSSALDLKLMDDLLKLGHAAGVLLEQQRTKDALMKLRKSLMIPSLGEQDVFERTLDIALANVRGIKTARMCVWDAVTLEAIELSTRYNTGNVSTERSETDITRVSVDSATPFVPEIVTEINNELVEWVTVEVEVPSGYTWRNNNVRRRFFASMLRLKILSGKGAAAEVLIFQDIIKEYTNAVQIKWERDQRAKQRKDLIKTIEGKLFSWKSLPMQDICQNTTQVAATVLPGADVYCGVLMPGANSIQFLAATSGSKMVDKVLNRPSGVSFPVIETLDTAVINKGDDKKSQYLIEGAGCQVYYGKKAFAGRIYKVRGHEKYDVEYLELQTYRVEAGVDVSRIVPQHTAFKMKHLGGPFQTPYVCIPLRHRDKGLGVLCMDTLDQVPRAPYDTQPEYGLQKFLEQLGRILGTTIDLQRKKMSLQELNVVSQNVNSELDDVLDAARKAVTDNMYFVETVQVCRVYYTTQEILSRGGGGIEMIMEWGAKNPDGVKRMESYHATRSNQKPVQQHGDKCVWLLLRLRGMTRVSKGKIYIISITQRIMPLVEPDLEYLNVLHKVLKSTMQSIDLKEEAGDSKSKALIEVKEICSKWTEYPRETLFMEVADRVNSVYLSANIYIGRLNAHGKELQFFLASGRSRMKGKRLPRNVNKPRVSISALDEVERKAVLPNMKEADELHHFAPPEAFEYPFVAVPLVAHIDAPVGVLCGDACEDPSAGGEDTGEVLSFFGSIGMYLSEPVRGYSQMDATAQLKQIAQDFPTLRQGMREIKRVVLSVVPNAMRVAEIEYEPRELRSMNVDELLGADTVVTTKDEYVVMIRIIGAKMHKDASAIKNPSILLKWMGAEVYKCAIKRKMDGKPMMFSVPRGVPTNNLQCQIILQGTVGGTVKELSKKTLGLQYLSNVPLTTVEHTLDSSSTDGVVHVAKLSLSSKMFYSSQVVSVVISSISIRGLAKADDYGLADPFVVFFWNGEELTQTSVQKNNLDPTWLDLSIDLRLDGRDIDECHLAMNVWDQDFLGRGDFLGRAELVGKDLNTLFVLGDDAQPDDANPHPVTKDSWIDLGKHPRLGEDMQELVQGRMKLSGSAILAKDLTPEQMGAELDVLSKLEKHSAFEEEDEEATFTAFHECEVRVLAGRGLSLGDNTGNLPSAFGIVRFNGEEVGRTAVIGGSADPEWEEETFTIRCPGGDLLEEYVLTIDIMHAGVDADENTRADDMSFDGSSIVTGQSGDAAHVTEAAAAAAANKGGPLGRVEVTGKALVALVAATHYQSRWLDIGAAPEEDSKDKKMTAAAKKAAATAAKAARGLAPAEGYGGRGELLLSGRPISHSVEAAMPVEAPILIVSSLGVRPSPNNQRAFNHRQTVAEQMGTTIKYETRILFNGHQIHRSGGVDEEKQWRKERFVSMAMLSEDEDDMAAGIAEAKDGDGDGDREEGLSADSPLRLVLPIAWGKANNNGVTIRAPNDRPLEHCVLEVQLWRSVGGGKLGVKRGAAGGGDLDEEDGPIVEKVASVTLKETELVDFAGQDVQRRRWFPLVAVVPSKTADAPANPTTYPDADLLTDIWLQSGPEEAKLQLDSDGREIHLDVSAARDLPRRSEKCFVERFGHPAFQFDKYARCQCSPVVQVWWNDELIGETSPRRNTGNAEWGDARFTLSPPNIDGVDESLYYCRLEMLVYDTGPGHVKGNAYAESHQSEESKRKDAEDAPRQLVGRVILEKGQLVAFLGAATLPAQRVDRWYPINGPAQGTPETLYFSRVDRDKECPYGELKLSAAATPPSRVLEGVSLQSYLERNGASPDALSSLDTPVIDPGTYLELELQMVEAKGLAKPDAFSASNPYVTIELDGHEVYRSDEIKDTSNPHWGSINGGESSRCLLRFRSLKDIYDAYSHLLPVNATNGFEREQREKIWKNQLSQEERELLTLALREDGKGSSMRRLLFNVWNHNVIESQRDEFLGCHTIEGEEAIQAFFAKAADTVCEDTFWLEPSDEMTPDENEFAEGQLVVRSLLLPAAPESVVTLVPAVLWIKGVTEIMNTKSFGTGSDVNIRVYRSYVREGGRDVLVHTTHAVGGTCSPEFVDELVHVLVPTSQDEPDWAGLKVRIEVWDVTTLDFFGCAVLDGHLLYHRLHRDESQSFESDSMILKAIPSELQNTVRAPNGGPLVVVGGDTAVSGYVEIAGGWKSYFDGHYKPQRSKVPTLGADTVTGGGALTATTGGDEDDYSLEEGDQEGKQVNFPAIDESGEPCEIHILKASDLPKADGMLGKSDPFCIVRWNHREVGRTAVVLKDLNPVWDDERFRVALAAAKASEGVDEDGDDDDQSLITGDGNSTVVSQIEAAATAAAKAVKTKSGAISLESVLDIDVWDQDTMGAGDFLGKVRLTGKDLATLLDPNKGPQEYPLTPSDELTPRSNKLATKGSIVLEGHIVSIQREKAIRQRREDEARRKEIEANPGMQASKVELHLLRAEGLSKVGMRGAVDAFFEVHWMEAETPRGPDPKRGVPTATTQVVKASLNPEFDNEVLTLEKPAGFKISDTSLRLVAFHKGAIKNEYLGEAVINGAEIVNSLPPPSKMGAATSIGEPTPIISPLLPFDGATSLHKKYVGGKVTFTVRQLGDSGATFMGKSKFIPPGMKEMQLTVLAASNLAKANMFGASDPYCVVRWARREIGTTATIQETCNPVWGESKPETFTFLAPDDLGLPYHVKEAANIAEEAKKFKKLQKLLMMEGKPNSDEVVAAIIEEERQVDNIAPPKELLLTVDIYDWNALNSGIYLGSVEIGGDDLNDFAAGGRHQVKWFDVTRTKRFRNSEQSLVVTEFSTPQEEEQRARLELMLGPSKVSSAGGKLAGTKGQAGKRVHLDEGEHRLDIEVCAARGLAKADTFGSADPYVKVFWNNVKIGATNVISNNQNPVWEDEKFYGTYYDPPLELGDCSMYFEVWDRDLGGDGDFLGSVHLSGEKLRAVVDKSRYHPKWYPLQVSRMLPKAVQDLVQGEVEIRIGDSGKMAMMMENAQRFEIEVIAAKNLARADGMFGLSDPYAIVKWNYNELGRTSYISKTLNPVWDGSNTFTLICSIDTQDDSQSEVASIGEVNHLQIDVWDYDMVGNGKFLGCAIISGKELDTMFKPSVLMDEDRTSTFGLSLDPRRDDQEGGITPKGTVEVKLRVPNETSGSLAQSINLKWDSERDVAAGTPSIEIDIVKVANLPITKVLQGRCSPLVALIWGEEEIGSTESGNSCNYVWPIGKTHFSLKIPLHAEINNSSLKFRVWDSEALSRGDFMGEIDIPFRGILRLQNGRFTMPLSAGVDDNKNAYVRGSLTFDLSIAYAYWDTIYPHIPTKILRRITVLSAKNLPGINDLSPTTKGVIQVEGFIKAKTQVSVKTSAPEWAPTDCVVVVDMHQPMEANVLVYHVDLAARKEFPIGQYSIPFELLVRPPKAAFDVPLHPPSKPPPKKYRFQVGGTVRISLTSDDTATDAARPFAFYHKEKPDASLVVHDVCPVTSTKKSKQDLLYDGERLSRQELFWMGSVTDLSRVTTLPTRPQWMIMPIHDVSQRVGHRAVDMIGVLPGHRMALAIERPTTRNNVSDSVLLDGISREVDHCIAQLRRKEIYRELRKKALHKFAIFLNAVADKEDFDVVEVEKYIYDAIQTCCPGVRVYIGRVSPDFQHIRYTLWEISGASRFFSIFKGMGSEWEFTGRHPPTSQVINKVSDFGARRINTYTSFPTTSFPRIVAPLAAGDVSLGFFGVENFDVYRGRMEDSLTDEREMVQWLQEMGKLCGESIYTGREKKALREMESYALGSGSTRVGVVVEILRACMTVLQGCKLMEVWAIDPDNNIRSLAGQTPISMPLPGRRVSVATLSIKVLGGKGLLGLLDDDQDEPGVDDGGDGHAAVLTGTDDDADGGSAETKEIDVKVESKGSTAGTAEGIGIEPRQYTFLVGLRYDSVEQLHPVTISEKETKLTVPLDMEFMLTFDRNLHVSLYWVDKSLKCLRDWYGKVSFTSFEEPSLRSSLARHKNLIPSFDFGLQLKWPDAGSEGDSSGAASTIDIKLLKLFNVSIKRARDLLPADGDTSDPFCELRYNGEMIGKTKHVDKTLAPTFNERFAVPFTGTKGPLTIDMYDMSMVGKGVFLGQVEIPFDLLLTPPPGEFEYPLRMKKELAARKQAYVGGMLTVEYEFEVRKEESRIDAKAAKGMGAATDSLEIPQSVWLMKTPSISLTIHSALNLAKANLFGGSSDPFVVVYLDYHNSATNSGKKKGLSDEPIFKTKVIDDNLSPEWNETFVVNLGMNMQQGVTTAKDFPTIRLEVFDYNTLMRGEFLGCCEIGPAAYFNMKHGEFMLGASPTLNARQNKLAQGELNVTFILQDNMATARSNDFTLGRYGTLEGHPCVEVHVVKAKDLMVAKKLSGRSDPYVVARWNDEDRGETSTKRGTLDPTWNNEKFVINLAEAGFTLPDLHLEVWDRDFFTGGEFIGEVVISGEELLQPQDSNTHDAPLKPREGMPNAKRIKGVLTYRLVSVYKRQALSFPPKEFAEVKTSSTASYTPVDIRVARDPEEEEKRQKFDKTTLPGIISKARQDTQKYHGEPFSRSGIISELHYGQLLSAVERSQHTVLKIDGRADMVCIPASADEGSAINPAGGDKNSPEKAKKATGARGKGNKAGKEPAKRTDELLYMVARYDYGQLPRRDLGFLTRFQSILVRGLQVATKRKERVAQRAVLVKSMEYVAEHTKHMANDVIVHGIVEVEGGIGASCELYTLLPDGKTFALCSKANGDPDITSEKANDFLMLAARLCRHGFMLQYFRGQLMLCDWSWLTTSQLAMVPLESIAEQIDRVEGDGYVHILLDVAQTYAPDGGWIVPLIGDNESMIAMLYVKDLDKQPYSAYRIRRLEDEAKRRKFEADKAAGKASAKRRKDFIECFGPEEGMVHTLRETGRGLGVALLKARMGDATKKMRQFPITHETTLLDILRNVFRVLVVAVPTIRGISIWAVDMAQEPSIARSRKDEARQLNFIEQLKKMLGLLPADGDSASKVPGLNKVNGDDDDNDEEGEEELLHLQDKEGFPEVLCGYFGAETPENLLYTHLQIMKGEVKLVEKKRFADLTDEDILKGRKAKAVGTYSVLLMFFLLLDVAVADVSLCLSLSRSIAPCLHSL